MITLNEIDKFSNYMNEAVNWLHFIREKKCNFNQGISDAKVELYNALEFLRELEQKYLEDTKVSKESEEKIETKKEKYIVIDSRHNFTDESSMAYLIKQVEYLISIDYECVGGIKSIITKIRKELHTNNYRVEYYYLQTMQLKEKEDKISIKEPDFLNV